MAARSAAVQFGLSPPLAVSASSTASYPAAAARAQNAGAGDWLSIRCVTPTSIGKSIPPETAPEQWRTNLKRFPRLPRWPYHVRHERRRIGTQGAGARRGGDLLGRGTPPEAAIRQAIADQAGDGPHGARHPPGPQRGAP